MAVLPDIPVASFWCCILSFCFGSCGAPSAHTNTHAHIQPIIAEVLALQVLFGLCFSFIVP